MTNTKNKLERTKYWLSKEKELLQKAIDVGKKRYGFMIKNPELLEPEYKYEKNNKYWEVVKEAMATFLWFTTIPFRLKAAVILL